MAYLRDTSIFGDLRVSGTLTLDPTTFTEAGTLRLYSELYTGGSDYGYLRPNFVNLELIGDSTYGASGIFFKSQRGTTNINHPSDYGMIQYWPSNYNGTSGETGRLVIGVANDSVDNIVFQIPDKDSINVSVGNQTATLAKVWHASNDGPSSGLNADLLDDLHASSFAQKSVNEFISGSWSFTPSVSFFNGISLAGVSLTNSMGNLTWGGVYVPTVETNSTIEGVWTFSNITNFYDEVEFNSDISVYGSAYYGDAVEFGDEAIFYNSLTCEGYANFTEPAEFDSKITATGGCFLDVMNANDGGTSHGIRIWSHSDANWGIYMATAGTGKSMVGNTTCTSLDGRASHHIRSRVANTTGGGFIWENNAETCLMSLTGNTGNLYTAGGICSKWGPTAGSSNDSDPSLELGSASSRQGKIVLRSAAGSTYSLIQHTTNLHLDSVGGHILLAYYDSSDVSFGNSKSKWDGANDRWYLGNTAGVGTSTTLQVADGATIDETVASGLGWALVVQNKDNNVGTATGVGFKTEGSANYWKGGIVYERTTTYARGDMHFLQDFGSDGYSASLADIAMTLHNDWKVTMKNDLSLDFYGNGEALAGLSVSEYGSSSSLYLIEDYVNGCGWRVGLGGEYGNSLDFGFVDDVIVAPDYSDVVEHVLTLTQSTLTFTVSAFGPSLTLTGALTAVTKNFEIDHPSKPDTHKLRHGVLEGPEHAVYIRGTVLPGEDIHVPDYWKDLVDMGTITVQLTPIGTHGRAYVEAVLPELGEIHIHCDCACFYFVQATRKDVPELVVEEAKD
jgi:hypothetical protein